MAQDRFLSANYIEQFCEAIKSTACKPL